MTILLFDGFETYSVGTYTALGLGMTGSPWSAAGSSSNIGTGLITGSTKCWSNSGSNPSITTVNFGAQNSLGGGFRCQLSSLSSNYAMFSFLDSASATQVTLRVNTSGAIEAHRGSTLLGTSASAVVTINTNFYLTYELVINSSTGSVKVWINGTVVLNLTSQNTKNTANAGVNYLTILGNFQAMFVDDLYITDGTQLGEWIMSTLYPTADSSLQLTKSTGATNFSCVDDLHLTADYVSGSASGLKDIYDLADLGGTVSAVQAVRVCADAQKTDTTTRTVKAGVKSSATESYTADFTLTQNAFTGFMTTYLTNPNGSIAWTPSAVNALQVELMTVS